MDIYIYTSKIPLALDFFFRERGSGHEVLNPYKNGSAVEPRLVDTHGPRTKGFYGLIL